MLVEIVQEKAIEAKPVMLITADTNDWRKPIIEYLIEGKLPSDDKEARKLRVKAPSLVVDNIILYKNRVFKTLFT